MMLAVEIVAVGMAVAYLWLAVRRNVWCWPAALVSVLLSIWLFYAARLYMESALQVFYAFMAVYGWMQWTRGAAAEANGGRIRIWPLRVHAALLVGIAALSVLFGRWLSEGDAAFPYWDSLTTVSAVAATFMVAHKVLENWVYWFVIDAISVFLYAARDLHLYAALFVLYLVLVIAGFRAWRREMQRQPLAPALT